MQKKVLAINDISCVGRCSLTVALPIISAAKIECSILPTAILYVSGKLNDVYIAYSIIPFSYVLNCVFVYLRYKKAFWYKQLV